MATIIQDLPSPEKILRLWKAMEVIKADFGDECGEHQSVNLNCVACQSAIVHNWLDGAVDLYYN